MAIKRLRTVVKDYGMKALRKQIRELKDKPLVKIGFQGSKGEKVHAGGELTNTEIATIHEYGTDNIPERSMIRSTTKENKQKYNETIEKLGKQIITPSSKMTVEKGLGIIGQMVLTDVRNKFTNNDWPALKDPTRGGKQSAGKPLLDTAQLRNSATYVVDLKGKKS